MQQNNSMNYQEFLTHIKDNISARLTNGRTVRIEPITKNNGMVYDGMIIIDPFINISPTIYLNPYYQHYLSGTSITDICDCIFFSYQKNLPTKDFNVSIFKDFSKAQKRIVMKLVNQEKNHALLQNIPHVPYLDMAIVFVCCVTELKQEFATILIQNKHLELWNLSPEQLYTIAKQNTPSLLPFLLEPMEHALCNLIDTSLSFFETLPLYILTNQLKINGATSMLYDGVLKQIADRLKSDLIILPSSIHEVILLPATDDLLQAYDYNTMINEVNATQLARDEILSDHAYYYSRKQDAVSM